jgi:prevent-host-death family protein
MSLDASRDAMILTVGTRDLKNRLTEYLRMVRAGASVVVTDRRKPVAELKPIGNATAVDPDDAHLLALAGRGQVGLPSARGPLTAFTPARVRGRPVSETILEDRR